MGKNCWVDYLTFMSSKIIGDVVTRQELLMLLNQYPESTVSADIGLALKKKFMKKIARGKYEITRSFPTYMTLAEFYQIPVDNLEYLEWLLNKKEQRL
ncbi:MAG: hypothetical protein ACREBR_04535 [bacterium]